MSKTEEVNELLKKLPLAPAGVERWVQECVVENAYIIFDSKQQKAVCTRCGKQFSMKHITGATHNHGTYCPKCGTKATYKAKHYGRKKLTEYFRILLFTHRGKTVYGTLFEVMAEFEPFGRPILNRRLSALYVFKENEQHYYKFHPEWCFGQERWEEVKRIRLPRATEGALCYPAKYERTELYMDNLESVFTKSCLKYHYDESFFEDYRFDAYDMVRYISQSLKYPAIELLRKAGFGNLVAGRVGEYCGNKDAVNIRGKDLKSILRLPKRWHKKVRELDMTNTDLRFFQMLDEEGKCEADQKLLDRCSGYRYSLKGVAKFVPIHRAIRYIDAQHSYLGMYEDYLEAAQAIGEPLDSKHALFPENLQQEHDRVTALKKVQDDEQSRRAMAEVVEKIKRQFPLYQQGSFLIRVAESQNELNEESKALTHCVRTYGEKMAKGKTMIFFVRWIDEPDVPFYTLELNDKKEMVQCRGNRNCNMTEEVKAFVDEWLEVIQKRPKKKKEAT